MANMYLSKLKGGSSVNLQASKTVTAGTDQQTFTPDSGYDAMEEVVVNPTPSTSITPSNATPVDISANTLYKPTAAGKAVESVSNITPSNSSPASMSSGGVYKSDGAGYAIESYQSKTPSSGGTQFDAGMVKMSSGGYAYDSQPSSLPDPLSFPWRSYRQASTSGLILHEIAIPPEIYTQYSKFKIDTTMSYNAQLRLLTATSQVVYSNLALNTRYDMTNYPNSFNGTGAVKFQILLDSTSAQELWGTLVLSN